MCFLYIWCDFEYKLHISYTFDVGLWVQVTFVLFIWCLFECKFHLSYSFDVTLSTSYTYLILLVWDFVWGVVIFKASASLKSLRTDKKWLTIENIIFSRKMFSLLFSLRLLIVKGVLGKKKLCKKTFLFFLLTIIMMDIEVSIWILFNFCSLKRHIFNDLFCI